MESKTLLHHNSHHPNHLKERRKGSSYGEREITQKLDAIKCKADELKSRFYEIKYHPSIIDKAYSHALTSSRSELLQSEVIAEKLKRMTFTTETRSSGT